MERYSVRISELANRDLRGIAAYITTQYSAPLAAAKKAKRLKEAINRKLSFMPQKYRQVNHYYLASKGYRRMNVENYIAFFTVDAGRKIVWVERVIHDARDWPRVLLEEA